MDDSDSCSPAELDGALRAVEADYPGWHAWNGAIPMLYARRVKSSPPIVVRAPTISGLRVEIEKALRGRRL